MGNESDRKQWKRQKIANFQPRFSEAVTRSAGNYPGMVSRRGGPPDENSSKSERSREKLSVLTWYNSPTLSVILIW